MRRSGRHQHTQGQVGSAIIYVMIFAAVVSILIPQISRLSDIGWLQTKDEELRSAREALYKRVSSIAGIEGAIYASMIANDPSNAALSSCLNNNSGCSNTPTNLIPFALYTPEGTKLTGVGGAPVNYDRHGKPCTQNCVFSAYASFWVGCLGTPTAANPCPPPDTVYTVVQIKTTGVTPFGLAAPPPFPKDSALVANTLAFANVLSKAQIIQKAIVCPPGTAAAQIGRNTVQCQPIYNTNQCPPTMILTGINATGQAVCVPDISTNCFTSTTSLVATCTINGCSQTGTLQVNCGYNGPMPNRLTGIQPVANNSPCQQIAAPNKKANPNDIGTQACTITYNYTCCR